MKLLIACAIATAPLLARADSKADAQKHLEAAAAAYKEKRWQVVLDELNKAYALDPKPELHFSIGQVYVKMGRCSDAIVSYEQYIASGPNADNVAMAKEAIDACKAAAIVAPDPGPVDPQPLPVEPTPAPPKEEPPPVVTPPPVVAQPAEGRWYQDKVGVALVGGGAAFVLAGVVTYALARGTLGDAEDAPTYTEQEDLYSSAKTKRTIAVVFTIAGLAAGGAGAYWYLKKRPAEQRGLAVVPTSDGGLITWSGGF